MMKFSSTVTRLILVSTLCAAPATHAVIIMETYNSGALGGGSGLAVPDGDPSGLANTQSVTTSNILLITAVVVDLDISGTFNGDLYAYLTHGSGFSVLLNRVGKTSVDLLGSSDDGFDVTFDDAAGSNIHGASSGGGTVTGTWQPDGRNVDPDDVVDTDDPTAATLATHNGEAADGDWTLFVADVSGGEAHTLNSWSVTITGDTVPEPTSLVLVALGTLGLLRRKR